MLADGSLLVIRRFDEYSDLYHVTSTGHVLSQLTADDQSTTNATLQLDHWILWPSVAPDGTDVYFATDAPKPAPNKSFEVDFSLWSAPLGAPFSIGDAGVAGGTRWSVPDLYTGGDIEPVPLPSGGVLYSSYANTGKGTVVTVLGLQTGPNSPMQSLTTPQQDCGAPAVASDGVTVAMVCTNSGQSADLEVATLEGNTLGPLRVLAANCLCNAPSWSPSRRQPAVHECRRPGRQLRALVHRKCRRHSSERHAPRHRRDGRPRCDVGRRVDESLTAHAGGLGQVVDGHAVDPSSR